MNERRRMIELEWFQCYLYANTIKTSSSPLKNKFKLLKIELKDFAKKKKMIVIVCAYATYGQNIYLL